MEWIPTLTPVLAGVIPVVAGAISILLAVIGTIHTRRTQSELPSRESRSYKTLTKRIKKYWICAVLLIFIVSILTGIIYNIQQRKSDDNHEEVMIGIGDLRERVDQRNQQSATPQPNPLPAEEAQASRAVSFNPPRGCPSPAGHRDVTATAEISVIYWCTGVFISDSENDISETQHQFKARLRIVNSSEGASDSISISTGNPSAIRLLLAEDAYEGFPDNWQPNPLTQAAGDKPELVHVDGEEFWAIPPDVNGDDSPAIYIQQSDGEGGWLQDFNSHWNPEHGDILEPGQSVGTDYIEPENRDRGDTSTNLVFTMPGPQGTELAVYGIVLFDIPDDSASSSDWKIIGECLHTSDEDECFAPPERQLASGLF